MADTVLGIDIGGSGIKANLVDLAAGEPVGERYKVATPQPSTPAAVAEVVAEIVTHFSGDGPVGVTFPAVIRRGVALSAANVDKAWVGTDAASLFSEATERTVTVLNDADAAGMAEMTYGAGRDREGVVICLTFGTGIGSALFTHGVLVPNTEFGHLEFAGWSPVEQWASAGARKAGALSWEEWALRVDTFLKHIGTVFSPDLVVFGGGVSRKFDKFEKYLDVGYDIVPAALENEAGIVGAAMAAGTR
ncbi:ROK family protein [soil metagenome]